jgi:hypothetical protein
MRAFALVFPTLRSLRRRIALLLAFAAVLIGSAAVARLLSAGSEHVELDRIFELGGTTLASAFLLLGWVVGRFPMIATLVLFAGFFSADRESGLARLYRSRPVSPITLYGVRFLTLGATVFLLSIVVLPLFDLVLLGEWAGTATFVLSAAYIIAYAGLVALLSVWIRGDAWVALLLGIVAISWDALRSADLLAAVPPGGRQFVSLLLPPHGALFALESAFGNVQPVPWNAFLDVAVYGLTLTLVAGLLLRMREI